MTIFKKYGKNRRLYNTSTKRYVNLDEIASLIRNGEAVQVIDAETGEDLTRSCLMQIIMDDSKERPTGIPLELLRQLIVASDHVGREFIMWYLQSAFDTYHKLQGALENGLTDMQSAAKAPVQILRNFIQGSHKQPDENAEIQDLRQRLAELEARLAESKSAESKSKKRPTPRKRTRAPRPRKA